MRWSTNLWSVALSGVMLLGGITLFDTTARADSCRDLSSEYRDLDRQIRRHGYYSRQADKERREIAQLRARCWGDNRGWGWGNRGWGWRDDDRRWRDRDWDRDDRRGWRRRDWDRDDDRRWWRHRDRDDDRWRHRDRDRDDD
ncbi:MAG TPA: hypothetical protein VKE24_16730 [Candidatus Acidoferrales bacterium]|nr:hypothetical protein [Candidatus Acidoferrales bacterium]